MRNFIFLFTVLFFQQSTASTFVGNGGNAGDIELQMTLGQIQKSLDYLDRDKDAEAQNLCVCSKSFEGRPLCDVLNHLNSEQVSFCSKFIIQKAPEIARILTQKRELSFSWTHQEIEVQEEGKLRGVDAVTNAKNRSITLNQKRFLEMDENEKIFLVGHELFHLTAFEGKTLEDEGEIGPFKGVDGGRHFINALAATVVLQANEYGVFRAYEEAERRSKSYKKNWITLGMGSVSTANNPNTAFDIEKASGGQVGYRYQWTQEIGLLAHFSALKGTKKILSTIEAAENRNIFGLGASYRWFPFSNPLTASGQSHFIFGGTIDLLDGTYKFHDLNPGTTSKTSSVGYALTCNYFIPFNSGVWAYGGMGYSNLHYSFNLDNQMDLNYENNGTTFALGVSYGF
ncbi:MAG TPA: putative metallopeptidase [Pseudobdellovibrionaceae bacterium]